MKRDIAMKWVKALRSGKYKQCKNVLSNGKGGFCCLGVLQGPVLGLPILGHEEVLSDRAKELSGVATCTGTPLHMHVGRKRADLADANDHRWSFDAIANFIEKHWDRL